MADVRRERVNTFGYFGLGNSSIFESEARKLGFLPNNIRAIQGATDSALAKALELISRSSELVSSQISQGQAAPAATSGDDMFFDVNAAPVDPLANI